MAPGKVNLNFHGIDTASGFVTRPDNPLIHEKLLGSTLDAANRTGVRTRFLRLDAGCRTPEAHAHPYWEELYLIEGDLVSIDAAGERVHTAPGYAAGRRAACMGRCTARPSWSMSSRCWCQNYETVASSSWTIWLPTKWSVCVS